MYTHLLPYEVRRKFCNLLDADHSWQVLGGQFMGLDDTDLKLVGNAYMRNSSPTDELLKKLDSKNVMTNVLCHYLREMNHYRALEVLRPYQQASDSNAPSFQQQQQQQFDTPANNNLGYQTIKPVISTLDTPTPSFTDQQPSDMMALMGASDLAYPPYQDQNQEQFLTFGNQRQPQCPIQDYQDNNMQQVRNQNLNLNQNQHQNQQLPPTKCHRNQEPVGNDANDNQGDRQQPQQQVVDAGEEIVRMACVNNRKRTSISDQEVVNQLRLIMQINYNELKLASDNFSASNILGNGGFASVYRGNWKGTDVAIKRLKCNLMDQALNELTILNSYRIDNILPIYGISIDGSKACLVYQFMSNGSLEDRLSCKMDTPPLTWNQRALIGEGVAKGLFYLHTLRDKPLVHGDVKSANVLLDSQFVPKLGDFGLARQVFKGKNPQAELCTHCTVSSIHGTSVYLPPEYLRHKILSPAVDVYSYGIVLLEMATGMRAYDGKRLLIDIVEDETQSMANGEISYSLKDPRLADDTQNDLKIWFELLIKLGLQCANKIKKRRPDMGQVLAKFAAFRNNSAQGSSPPSLPNQLYPNYGTGTTRTLSPELTQNGQPMANNNHGPHKFAATHQQVPLALNSTLMSVEEEADCSAINQPQDRATYLAENVADKVGAVGGQVEAIIPLLTELGLQQES